MIRGKFDQARCQSCKSWHFAVQLDQDMNPIEYKCCRCGRIIKAKTHKRIENEKVTETDGSIRTSSIQDKS